MDLCLNLIVKNEQDNMRRCLDCFNQLKYRLPSGEICEAIKAIAIVDTGSTDNTIEIIEEWIKEKGKKGSVISRPWKGSSFHYALNRNISLAHAYDVIKENRYNGDNWYITFTDADNIIKSMEETGEMILPELTHDRYLCEYRAGYCHFEGNFLVKYDPTKGWSWRGGLHEFLAPKESITSSKVTCLWMDDRREGCRSQADFKYIRDTQHLRNLIKDCEKFNKREVRGLYEEEEVKCYVRYHFYLGQSIRDSAFGMEKQAEEVYIKRTTLGDWPQEIYVSFIEAYRQRVIRKGKVDLKAASYLEKAFEVDPERLEAPYYYIRYLNAEKRFNQAWNFSKPLLKLEKKDEKLFIESHIYSHAFLDEAAVSCFYTGNKSMAKILFEKVLQRAPETEKERIKNNIAFC